MDVRVETVRAGGDPVLDDFGVLGEQFVQPVGVARELTQQRAGAIVQDADVVHQLSGQGRVLDQHPLYVAERLAWRVHAGGQMLHTRPVNPTAQNSSPAATGRHPTGRL